MFKLDDSNKNEFLLMGLLAQVNYAHENEMNVINKHLSKIKDILNDIFIRYKSNIIKHIAYYTLSDIDINNNITTHNITSCIEIWLDLDDKNNDIYIVNLSNINNINDISIITTMTNVIDRLDNILKDYYNISDNSNNEDSIIII